MTPRPTQTYQLEQMLKYINILSKQESFLFGVCIVWFNTVWQNFQIKLKKIVWKIFKPKQIKKI